MLIEIKPRSAPAIHLGRCIGAASARAFLATIAAEHQRPFLGEIGAAA